MAEPRYLENYSLFNLFTTDGGVNATDYGVDYEPKTKNRFAFYIPHVPQIPFDPVTFNGLENVAPQIQITGSTDDVVLDRTRIDNLLISLKSINRPQYSSEAYEVEHFNEKIYLPGKPNNSRQITCEFNDFIINKGVRTDTNNSTATLLYRWYNLIYNLDYGTVGYKDQFVINAHLYLIDPHGKMIENWIYYNTWPAALDYKDLSYADNSICEISVTFQYDKAKLVWAEESYNEFTLTENESVVPEHKKTIKVPTLHGEFNKNKESFDREENTREVWSFS